MNDFAALESHIRRLRALPDLARNAAPDVAAELDKELKRQISRGQGPDGTPWAPRQDGGKPLAHAGKAVYVAALGTKVIARVAGPEARHNSGRARGGVKRQILPSKDLPKPVVLAIKRVLSKHFSDAMGGA